LANNWRLQRTEEKLGRQREILQIALDNIRHGIAYFDARGRLAAFNRRFFSKLQFPTELAVIGAPLERFRAIEQARGTASLEASGAGAAAQLPLSLRLNGSEFEVYRMPTADGGFVVSSVDVTQRVRAEAMFRQVQKMESIGQLTGGVAHDFNNLLQIVRSNIDLALAAGVGDERLASRLRAALDGTERGARLTRQLLAFARRQPLEPVPTNLGRLVADMTEMVRRSLGETIQVETVVAGGLWNAMADPGQLENAILNLAINARDAMHEGGRLTLEVANASLDEDYAAEHVEVRPGQYVMVAVSDTGTGMSQDVIAQAFEPFFTTKADGQGTGLGLSQVYGYVKQLGGHVKIYSEPGHGTTVKLYLPRTRQPEEMLQVAALTPIEFGRETVLVVEDDPAVRAGAVDMLGDLGYRVLQAASADSALAVLSSGAAVDVLFTDVVMPGPVKVRELVRQTQAHRPGIAVLYTSGYTENAIIHDGRLDADVLLISKPYRRDELARKLRTAIERARARAAEAKPVNGTPDTAGSSIAPAAAEPDAAAKTVLFVEDDALVRMSAVDYLQHAGFAVVEAGNAEQALQALQAQPAIDVMLTDLGLPGMGGMELIAAALRLRPGLRVAVLSGRSGEEIGALPAGAARLDKPYELERLRLTILELRQTQSKADNPV
ncbi:MAG: response regulator, partial [Reyranellaceae bacterium]